MIKEGQGLLLKLNFADGGICKKRRTFLVVGVEKKELFLLNISSADGKGSKLTMSSNLIINRYRPPFIRKSFAKLDAIYVIPNHNVLEECSLLCDGRAMHPKELENIIKERLEYDLFNSVNTREFDLEEVASLNEDIKVTLEMLEIHKV